MITYRQITTQDPEYEQEQELRNRVLRIPLGLTLSENDLRNEEKQVHLVAMDEEGRVIGCVLAAFLDTVARIRQIAIDETYRKRGIGTELMKRAEQVACSRNVKKITLHGRVTAKTFFERLGYQAASEVFTEVTIPHIAMEKACPA